MGITARAIDPDRGSVVTYSLSDDSTGLFSIDPQSGVVTLNSDDYDPERDYPIEVTARSNDGSSSVAQFTVRADEPIRIASSPTASILEEGESQDVTFSFIETDLELIAISAGDFHTCAITSDNDAVCWGDSTADRDEDMDGQSDPFYQNMPPAGKFIAVGSGAFHSCGITPDNDAACWGFDTFDQTTPTPGEKFIAVSRSLLQ